MKADVGNVLGLGFVGQETLGYWYLSGPSDVMVVEADASGHFKGQTPRRISRGLGSMPSWSADGRMLAWSWMLSYAGEIRISDSRGRTIRRIQPRADVGDISDVVARLKAAGVLAPRPTHPRRRRRRSAQWQTFARLMREPHPHDRRRLRTDMAPGRTRGHHQHGSSDHHGHRRQDRRPAADLLRVATRDRHVFLCVSGWALVGVRRG